MRLLTPGPASSLPQVLAAMAVPLIHHRTNEFQTLYQTCVNGLKQVFQTEQGEIAILSGSGTTGLEAGILNAFDPDDQVLIIDSGYFGERLASIAKIHHLDVIHYQTGWQETYDMAEIDRLLQSHPYLKGILMVYSETSTGALHNIQAIGERIKDTSILLMVDCISGLVMNPFLFDAWHVDIAVAASQKGFFLPPGLAFVCMSDKAMKRARSCERKTYYLNLLVIIDKYHDEQKIGSTPNISLLQGLRAALTMLGTQSMEEWNQYYANLHGQLGSRLLAMGYPPYTNTDQSHSLYVCQLPNHNAFAIRNQLFDDTNILIEVGLGECSGQILRIGCMNAVTLFDILDLCRGLQGLEVDG